MYEYEYLICFGDTDTINDDNNEVVYIEAIDEFEANEIIDNLYHKDEGFKKILLNKVKI